MTDCMPTGRRRVFVLGIGVGAAMMASVMPVRPPVRLGRVVVPADVPVETLRQRLIDRLDQADVVARGDGVTIAAFQGRAGPFPYHTLEEVRATPDGVTFRHLRGPLPRVEETIAVTPTGPRTASLVHTGTVEVRGGLVGWIFGVLVVRPVFDAHARSHLAQIADRPA
jgi:hypothetical protein